MRRLIQFLSLLVSNSFFPAIWRRTIYQGGVKCLCTPILNCYACPLAISSCPIGAFQNFLVRKSFPVYVIGMFGVIGMLLGRWTCGWLCPFGFLQDILYKIKGKKLALKKGFMVSRYVVFLVLVIIIPLITLEPWFCKLCPQGTLQGGIPIALGFLGEELRGQILISSLFYLKIGILLAVVLLSIFIKRFFCRVICPIGVILGFFNKISLLQMGVNLSKCSKCGICKDVCPMDIEIYKEPNSLQCIRCMECKRVCPEKAISVMGWAKG